MMMLETKFDIPDKQFTDQKTHPGQISSQAKTTIRDKSVHRQKTHPGQISSQIKKPLGDKSVHMPEIPENMAKIRI